MIISYIISSLRKMFFKMTPSNKELLPAVPQLPSLNQNPLEESPTIAPETLATEEKETTKIYDELVDLDAICAADVIANTLSPSDAMITKISNIIKEAGVKYIPLEEKTDELTFTLEDKQYVLEDPTLVKRIYIEILDLKSHEILNKTLEKTPNILKNLSAKLENAYPVFENELLKEQDPTLLIAEIIRLLSSQINNQLQNKKRLFFFTKTYLSEQLGKLVFHGHLNMKYIYDLKPLSTVKHRVRDFNRNPREIILKYYEELKGKPQTALTEVELIFLEQDYLKLKEVTPEEYVLSHKKIAKYCLLLGAEILKWLISIDFFIQVTKKNAPCVVVNENLEITLMAAASFNKPCLLREEVNTMYSHEINDKTVIRININNNIHYDRENVRRNLTPKFEDLLKKYRNTPIAVNISDYEDFLSFYKGVFQISASNIEDQTIFLFFKAIYDIDFEIILKKSTNKSLIKNLMSYGLNLNTFFDTKLLKTCQANALWRSLFYKIFAVKYNLIGLLNDLNIYKHFNHFFIPYHPTNTGRLLSSSYFLQFQGSKLVFNFLSFAEQDYHLSENQINNLITILKKTLPEMEVSKVEQLYTESQKTVNAYADDYIESFFHKTTNITEYPFTANIGEQLLWLSKHCLKSTKILHARNLLHSRENNRIASKIYQKDATSSGLQLISLLMRDKPLATKTNLLGNTSQDIYTEVLEQFLTQKGILENYAAYIAEKCFEKSLQQFFEYRPPRDTVKKTLFDYLHTLLFSETEEQFDSLYAGIHEHIKTSPLEKKLLELKFPITNLSPEAKLYKKKNPLYMTLWKIREYFINTIIFSKLPESFFNRKIFKHVIMAYGYNEKNLGRFDWFRLYIKDFFFTLGEETSPLTKYQENSLVLLLNYFFCNYGKINLKCITNFIKETHTFIEEHPVNARIVIPLKYLTWSFQEIRKTASRHRIPKENPDIKNKRSLYHQAQIIHYFGIDRQQMTQTFSSIFIQGLDAHIVHNILDQIATINEYLKQEGLPLIYVIMNHDCFGINMFYAPLLEYLVKNAYNSINNLNLDFMPTLLSKQKQPIICENPNCIKY